MLPGDGVSTSTRARALRDEPRRARAGTSLPPLLTNFAALTSTMIRNYVSSAQFSAELPRLCRSPGIYNDRAARQPLRWRPFLLCWGSALGNVSPCVGAIDVRPPGVLRLPSDGWSPFRTDRAALGSILLVAFQSSDFPEADGEDGVVDSYDRCCNRWRELGNQKTPGDRNSCRQPRPSSFPAQDRALPRRGRRWSYGTGR